MVILFVVNLVFALGSAFYAAKEFWKPGDLAKAELTEGGRFYSLLYSIRGVPLGIGAAVAPFLTIWGFEEAAIGVAVVLLIAFVVQALDVVLLARKWGVRNVRPLGAFLAAAAHLATAIVVICNAPVS